MILSPMRRIAAVCALVAAAGVLCVVAAASATGSSQQQRRQIAVTRLSDFKVVLTATRGSAHPLLATVTASGYRRTGGHWQLISTKRIGDSNGWYWYPVAACSLTATQLKNNTNPSPPVVRFDSIKVSLLITPAIGCSGTYRKHWTP